MAKTLCEYHSGSPATWECEECSKAYCGKCVVLREEPGKYYPPRCPLCQKELEFLGTGQHAKPFWTVAPMLFTYPFRGSGIPMLAVAGGLGYISGTGLFTLPLLLLLLALIIRYAFGVLIHIANGNAGSPSLTEVMQNDEQHLFFKFIGLSLLMGLIVGLAEAFLGPAMGTVMSIVMSILMPAAIIFLASDAGFFAAFMPHRLLWLIVVIGWPYALVVFLTNVLSAAPMLVGFFLNEESSIAAALAMMAVAYAYFTNVNFALLGYVIFERQGELGYVAGSVEDVMVPDTTENRLNEVFGAINVFMKEGREEDALKLLHRAQGDFKGESKFYDRAMRLALAAKNESLITSLTNSYLDLLVSKDAVGQALEWCRKAIDVVKTYRPRSPGVSHQLAEEAYARNLNREALLLLVNLHKRSPDYDRLGDAYRLAASIFRDGLGDDAKARQLEDFIAAKGLA